MIKPNDKKKDRQHNVQKKIDYANFQLIIT